MFYANIQSVKMGAEISLECQVKYTKFTLNESILNQIHGLPTVVQPLLPWSEFKTRCLVQFANPRPLKPPHCPISSSNESCLLYYIIVHTFLPKPNSIASINTKTLEAIYLHRSGKLVNFFYYILEYTSRLCSVNHLHLSFMLICWLWFSNTLQCVENEIRETRPVPLISPCSLKFIQFIQIESDA